MYRVDELRSLVRAYIDGTGIAETALADKITPNNNLWVKRLLKGHGIAARTLEKASDWFDANWPRRVLWPKDVATADERVPRHKPIGQAASEVGDGA